MQPDMSQLEQLQRIVDTYKEARAELNRAILARMAAQNESERIAASWRQARLSARVELLKRQVVDVAAGRLPVTAVR
jgi:hypothetical protein